MRFGEWLSQTGTSQATAAEVLQITQGRVSQLVLGGWPGRELAVKIRDFTDGAVTADDFLPPSDVAEVAQQAGAAQ